MFVRGVAAEFDTREELLSLEVMLGARTGEDLFKRLVSSMEKLELPFEKLNGLTRWRWSSNNGWLAKGVSCICHE